jgi:hypothetical protein
MRRLLSALRDIQNDCTDTECEGPSGTGDGGLSLPLLLTIWGITALVLFLVRPASMRQTARDRQINEKQRINQVIHHFLNILML